MAITSRYVFFASMDVEPEKESLFNEVYDTEHISNLLKVPGVSAVTRMAGADFKLSLGGRETEIEHAGPRYVAIYEIEDPAILTSPEWAAAVEEGRWPTQVRPFTHNRAHALYKLS